MYQLPKLPYDYGDLEPVISSETLKLHYDILYKGSINGTNNTLDKLNVARTNNNYSNIKALEKDLAFYSSGMILHNLFFFNLNRVNESVPSSKLLNRINTDFGSFANFVNQFNNSILNIEGSGWGIMGYNPNLDKLIILQCEKHQNLTSWGIIPLLVIDIWEHSYYLDYQTNKKEYMKNIWKIIDFDVVNKRFEEIKLV